MSFDHLGLRPELLRAVAEQGYEIATPVQLQAIPIVLSGKDLLAGAQTGTGKTAAFVLPMLQRLREGRPTGQRRVRALVVTPTRELALQVEESVRTYGRHLPVSSVAIYGGVGMEAQIRALRAGAEIVVATPGRLLDHVNRRTVRLDGVEILVLDEADRMLDMGFINDIRKILALLPDERQSLLFSATFSADIRALAERLLRTPKSVDVAPRNSAAELVAQIVHPVDKARKPALLSHLLRSRRIHQALVFTRTKHGADRLTQHLVRDGIDAMAIHGNKAQNARVRALAAFKNGRAQVLVATDIAARGIDIDQLPHVVNYELPNVPEDYVHRIGRTGRAGVVGAAVSLVSADEAVFLRDIERLLKAPIQREVVEGFAPDPALAAEAAALAAREAAASRGRRGGGQRQGAPGLGAPRIGVARASQPHVARPDVSGQPVDRRREHPAPARGAQPAAGGGSRGPRPAEAGPQDARGRGGRPAGPGAARPAGVGLGQRPVGIGAGGPATRSSGANRPRHDRPGQPRPQVARGGGPATGPRTSGRPSGGEPRPVQTSGHGGPAVLPGERIAARGDRSS